MPLGMDQQEWEAFVQQQMARLVEEGERANAVRAAVPPMPREPIPRVDMRFNGLRADVAIADGLLPPEDAWEPPEVKRMQVDAKKDERPKKKEDMFKYLVKDMIGIDKPIDGRFGIEIEVEGRGLPIEMPYFKVERDGSLRGEGLEYILAKPMDLKGCNVALTAFEKCLKDVEAHPDMSFRTSVHVHVNAQPLNKIQLCTFLYLAYLFENPLVNFCGPTRIGNRFCLRLVDAEDKAFELEYLFFNRGMNTWDENKGKYSAINLASLRRQGSVEFRSMRGTVNKDEIYTWITLLNHLYEVALTFKSPAEIADLYLELGVRNFAKRILGEHLKTLDYDGMDDALRLNFSLLIKLPYEEIKDFA